MIKSPDSGGQGPKGDTVASARVDVGAVAQAFHDGVKNQDAAVIGSLYHENARLLAPNMPACEGRLAIQAAMQALFDAGARSLVLEALEVRDEGVVTIEYGRFTLVIEPPGAPSITDTGKYIVVHETRGGRRDEGLVRYLQLRSSRTAVVIHRAVGFCWVPRARARCRAELRCSWAQDTRKDPYRRQRYKRAGSNGLVPVPHRRPRRGSPLPSEGKEGT